MKKIISLFVILLASVTAVNGSYRISLLTCGAGEEIYTIFGHSAMRVVDSDTGEDKVYNFGMFDFQDPGFIIKFLRGDLDYFVGTQPYGRFVEIQYYSGIVYLKEQVLNLTDEQASRIAGELERRYMPENRYYKYKFLQRNCTTELRDIIVANIDTDAAFLKSVDGKTYRYYLNECMEGHPWIKLGVNLLLGSRIDSHITAFDRMCLPGQLLWGLDNMYNGGKPLVVGTTEIYSIPEEGRRGPDHWVVVLIMLVVIVVLSIRSRVAGSVFLMALGLLGCLLLFFLFYGTHMEFKENYNVLWCNPLYLPLGIAILLKRRKASTALAIISVFFLWAMAVMWIYGVQSAETAFILTAVATVVIIILRVKPVRRHE